MSQETVNLDDALARAVLTEFPQAGFVLRVLSRYQKDGKAGPRHAPDVIDDIKHDIQLAGGKSSRTPQAAPMQDVKQPALSRRDQQRRWAEMRGQYEELIRACRYGCFGSEDAPFSSDEEAADWCRQQKHEPSEPEVVQPQLDFFNDSTHQRIESINIKQASLADILRQTAAHLADAVLTRREEMLSHLLTGRDPALPWTSRIRFRVLGSGDDRTRQVTITTDERDVTYDEFRKIYRALRRDLKTHRQKQPPRKVQRLFRVVERHCPNGQQPPKYAETFWKPIQKECDYNSPRAAATAYHRWSPRLKHRA